MGAPVGLSMRLVGMREGSLTPYTEIPKGVEPPSGKKVEITPSRGHVTVHPQGGGR